MNLIKRWLCKNCESETDRQIKELSKKFWRQGDSLDFLGVYVTDFDTIKLIPMDERDLEIITRNHTNDP